MYCCTTFLLQPTTLEQNVSSLSLPFCQSVFSLFFLRSVWRICGSTFPFDGFDNFYTRCQQSVFSLSLFSFPSLSFPFVNQSTKLVERVVRIIFFHKLLLLLLCMRTASLPFSTHMKKVSRMSRYTGTTIMTSAACQSTMAEAPSRPNTASTATPSHSAKHVHDKLANGKVACSVSYIYTFRSSHRIDRVCC